jgi:Ca2+-transporting ATPase
MLKVVPTRFVLQIIPILLVGLWLWLSYLVLQTFLLTIAWALIVAYVLFPLYRVCLGYLKGHENLSAAVVTVVIAVFLLILVVGVVSLLQEEIERVYPQMVTRINQLSYELPQTLRAVPHIGQWLQKGLDYLQGSRHERTAQFLVWSKMLLSQGAHLVGRLGEYGLKFSFMLTTVFFCLRDGEKWLMQMRRVCKYYLEDEQGAYLQVAGDTSRAVVYGLVLAALGQGSVAAIGYAVAGVDAPLLLGALTTLLALIPMGAVLVWLPTALMLIAQENYLSGGGLLVWGVLAISTVDNVIRPLVICGTSHIPFLVVLLGVFGGLGAFGAIGLFLGPVILSVLLEIWRQNLNKIPM